MFQIGLGECLLVVVVASVVLGPERLPAIARVCGRYLQQLKNLMLTVKNDIASEMQSSDLKQPPKDES